MPRSLEYPRPVREKGKSYKARIYVQQDVRWSIYAQKFKMSVANFCTGNSIKKELIAKEGWSDERADANTVCNKVTERLLLKELQFHRRGDLQQSCCNSNFKFEQWYLESICSLMISVWEAFEKQINAVYWMIDLTSHL